MTRTKKILVIGIPVLIAIGVAAKMVSGADKKFPVVTVQKAERTDLRSLVTATGKTEAQRKVDLSANVMGQIVNLAVREGDAVEEGRLPPADRPDPAPGDRRRGRGVPEGALLRPRRRPRPGRGGQEELRARRALVRGPDHSRRPMSTAPAPRSRRPTPTGKAVERRIEQSRANLAGARDELSKTKMLSPIDGVITALPVEEGEVAVIGTMNNPGTKLMTISDMGIVEAVMEVDETDIPSVKVGQTAEVRIDAFGERKFEGVVTEVGSSPIASASGATDAAVNFEVRIQLKDLPPTMRPGFSCSADILTGTAAGVLAVPIQALVVREKEAEGEAKPTRGRGRLHPEERRQEEDRGLRRGHRGHDRRDTGRDPERSRRR